MSSATSPSQSGYSGGQTKYSAAGGKRAPWLSIDWRNHQRWVEVEGAPINVIELGSGDPVLFIHGLGGSWPNWLEQLPVICAGWRAIAIDLPGFGESPMPKAPISIPNYARIVGGVMDALGIGSAAIVGNSMGGEISLELALSAPERVRRMLLVSPAGISTVAVEKRMPLIRGVYPLVNAASRWVGANADEIVRRPRLRAAALSVVAAQPRRIAPEFGAEQIRGTGKPGFLPALEAIVAHSGTLHGRLGEISCPTLILWGDKDPVVPVRDAEVFAKAINGARKVVWEHTGHVAMFERAAEFNALLEGFLTG